MFVVSLYLILFSLLASYIYIYIYISAVKICALTQAINFFQLNVLKIFYAINAGAGLGLATALTTAVSVTISLDKKCIYSVAERLYDRIKRETFQTRAPLHLSSPQSDAPSVFRTFLGATYERPPRYYLNLTLFERGSVIKA